MAHLIKALRVGCNFQQKKNIKEEEEYREAIDRYLRGNTKMSCKVSNGTVQNQLFIWSMPFYCTSLCLTFICQVRGNKY